MVKGTTRQVLVVKGSDTTMFEQAIFLVRDNVLKNGGVSEEALLQEAKHACRGRTAQTSLLHKLLWGLTGAGATGLLWAASALL